MNSSNKLYNTAREYRDAGWSVIPIWGAHRPDRFKAAAVRWRGFQAAPPSDETLAEWFLQRKLGGLAVVCGAVSQLAVLDFDDPDLAASFAALHPDLTATRMVRSGGRGLPHYYYHIPAHLHTQTRHASGVDWQYNGAYVIAPPTSSADATWTVQQASAPKILTEADLSRIMAFILATTHNNEKKASTPRVRSSDAIPSPSDDADTPYSPGDIIQFYRERARMGRNNALFQTACWLRDGGGTTSDAMILVNVHVTQPPNGSHPAETPDSRREEALKTILSAFNHQPRQPKDQPLTVVPNALRERLLHDKQTAVLRVLEAIHQAGWQAGQIFTRDNLIEIAQTVGIGDWSVRKALAVTLPGDESLFPEAAKRADAAVLDGVETPQLNAIELRVTAPTEIKTDGRGRPPAEYCVPSLRAVCKLYGITWTAGDALNPEALAGVRQYREALHRALLARRPGIYHREWLAQRLGISLRTLCRYNTTEEIRVSPRYIERRVMWNNLLNVVPNDLHDPLLSHYGAFLEDENGKRYPPFLSIARRLLRAKRAIVYKRRIQNHYSVLPTFPQAVDTGPERATTPIPTADPPRRIEPPYNGNPPPPPIPYVAPQRVTATPPHVLAPRDLSPRDLSPNEAQTAADVYQILKGAMAQARAENLIRTYGRFAVQAALDTVTARGDAVRNPAGFLVRLLAQRHGRNGDAISTAEGLFLTLHTSDGRPRLGWRRACALVDEYGIAAVSNVLLNLHAQGNTVQNPVGYVMSTLKQGAPTTADLTTAEAAINALVTTVREINPDRSLTRTNARKLVRKYGLQAVSQALAVLQSRNNIDNPAGFIIVFLRSESNAAQRERQSTS